MPAPLTSTQIRALIRPGLHRVDRGLYLQVQKPTTEEAPHGPRSWIFRYALRGRRRVMGLGPFPDIPLKKAQSRADAARLQVLDGIDPLEIKHAGRSAARATERAAEAVPVAHTFTACAEAYMKAHSTAWSNPKHAEQWERTLATYAGPIIGHLAVDAINVDHMVQILEPIWASKSETAGRLRGRIEKVLGWAESKGYRSGTNPATWRGPLGHRLPALSKVQKIEHHAAVPYADTPALYKALVARGGTTSKALAFTLLTASRSGEVRGAKWGEIDREAGVWVVPAERMKTRTAHRVALSAAALALLPPKDGKPDALVFAGTKPGKPLSDMTLLKAIRTIWAKDATVHGLRSSFRDWAAEATDYPRELIESALAHLVGTEVERAYLRTDLIEKRRDLMEDWASHVTGEPRAKTGEARDVA